MIEVRELRKSFGTTVAVDGVSFELGRGETFGLLGPNGAGKTTTIGMLVGVLRPDGGTVLVNGSSKPTETAARLSSAGVAFQTLEVARPDLETVFLTLTGRSLRD